MVKGLFISPNPPFICYTETLNSERCLALVTMIAMALYTRPYLKGQYIIIFCSCWAINCCRGLRLVLKKYTAKVSGRQL